LFTIARLTYLPTRNYLLPGQYLNVELYVEAIPSSASLALMRVRALYHSEDAMFHLIAMSLGHDWTLTGRWSSQEEQCHRRDDVQDLVVANILK
jgi:hypothetical protein